ncbi:hypothetical protein HS125_01475 [bacterium]|nr:hypothetical protein [bacterium]
MKTGNFVRSLLCATMLLVPGLGRAAAEVIELTSGVPVGGFVTPILEGAELHDTQYRITVPQGAVALQVVLTYGGTEVNPGGAGVSDNLDLLVRLGSEVSQEQYDHRTSGGAIPDVLTITGESDPPLSPGVYYIGIEKFTVMSLGYELTATVSEGPSPTPSPSPSPSPTPTPPPTGLLGVVFPPQVVEGVPLNPVRSVQARARGDVSQMIPLAFKMQTPPPTYSAQAGHDVYLPGSDAHFYSLTWQKSDRVPGIPEGLMLGDPYVGLPGPPPYDPGIGSLFGMYPNLAIPRIPSTRARACSER